MYIETELTGFYVDGDKYHENKGAAGTINTVGDVEITMKNTEFVENNVIGSAAGMYVEKAVEVFTCYRCLFRNNTAQTDSALIVSSAEMFRLIECRFESNSARSGFAVKIFSENDGIIQYCQFANNTSGGLPRQIDIETKSQLSIQNTGFLNHAINQSIALSSNPVVIKAKKLLVENVDSVMHTGGYAIKSDVSGQSLVDNITYVCPSNYVPKVEYGNKTSKSQNATNMSNSGTDYALEGSINMQCTACEENEYNLIQSLYSIRYPGERKDLVAINTGFCYGCPSGGMCAGTGVTALPNYWGFIHDNRMYFELCPPEYCCQKSPCASHDTCAEGREGMLCASCMDGYRLAFLMDSCLPSKSCDTAWIGGIIVVTGLLYIAFLVCKVEIVNFVCYLFTFCEEKEKNSNSNEIGISYDQRSYSITGESDKSREVENDINGVVVRVLPVERERKPWKIPLDYVEIFHIIVYHFQDNGLFYTDITDKPVGADLLGDVRRKFVKLARLDSTGLVATDFVCLSESATATRKALMKVSIVPFMVFIFLIFTVVVKLCRMSSQLHSRIMYTAVSTFLLIIIFSSQQMSTTAFSLVKCAWFGTADYLIIDATVQCYQPWQIVTFFYILFFIMPFWICIFVGPGLLRSEMISLHTFLIGLLVPTPFLVYCAYLFYKHRHTPVRASCPNQIESAVIGELWASFRQFFTSHILCWGGIVELRRLALVICATLITSPIGRISCMLCVLLCAVVIHVRYNPYLDGTTNLLCNISLIAMVLVAVINFGWSTVIYIEADFSHGDARDIAYMLVTVEDILIQWLPVGMVIFCTMKFLYVNFLC